MLAPIKNRLTRPLPLIDAERAARVRKRIAPEIYACWGKATDFLDAVFAAAPYLARTAWRRSGTLKALGETAPEILIEQVCDAAKAAVHLADEVEVMRSLRLAKLDIHLITALADLADVFTLQQVTMALSDFADVSVQTALASAARSYGVGVGDLANPLPGYFVLCLGKHGTRSLNFSSDVDLVIVFEPGIAQAPEGKDPVRLFTRITRKLSHILQEVTADGYVFRVDLRLRPDPGSTPVAVNAEMARRYFEAAGQNWERAAYAKARVCAGDRGAGQEFLENLTPFIWRRTLDFAAVEDIQALVKQIQIVGRCAEIQAPGHDVKLGRGGIREIELYAQCLQLVFGGRMPALRISGTVQALSALASHGLVDTEEAEALTVYYNALRDVEHRIQMLEDEQSQTLPVSEARRRAVAALSGESVLKAFDNRMMALFGAVHAVFTAQFEDGDSLATQAGSLVLTGVEPTPDTRETLISLGFAEPDQVWKRLAGWAAGRARAVRTERARQLFTRFVPRLVEGLAVTGDPNAGFTRFCTFFEGLPGGVQPLSLLVNQPELARDIITILGLAPRLAEILARRPALLDTLLASAFARPLREDTVSYRSDRFGALVDLSYEDALNTARRLAREEHLRIGSQLLLGRACPRDAGAAYADLADACVRVMASVVLREMTCRHGPAPGRWAVLGLGKLGGRELSSTSDLDIMVVYDEDQAQSEGSRLVGVQTWFTRFTQRLVSALSAPTEEGKLYDVDLALRPSGGAGPVAVRFSRFVQYYASSEAWTWERMAMTRARLINDEGLGSLLSAAIAGVIAQAGPVERLRLDAASMRARLERDKSTASPWNIKLRKGGMMDLEFIAQLGQLAQGRQLSPSTPVALEQLMAAGWLRENDAETLIGAHKLYSDLTQLLKAAHGERFNPDSVSEPFARRLSYRAGCEDLDCVLKRLQHTADQVRRLFLRYVGSVHFPVME